MEYGGESYQKQEDVDVNFFDSEFKNSVTQTADAVTPAAQYQFQSPQPSSPKGEETGTSAGKASNVQSPTDLPSWNRDNPPIFGAANATGLHGLNTQQPTTGSEGLMEAMEKQIETRTANIDLKTKEKETSIKAAAQSYMREEIEKYEERLKDVKAQHLHEQTAGEKKRNMCKENDNVWKGVGLVTDLSRTNKYSKNTERMRSILNRLTETTNA